MKKQSPLNKKNGFEPFLNLVQKWMLLTLLIDSNQKERCVKVDLSAMSNTTAIPCKTERLVTIYLYGYYMHYQFYWK